MQFQDLLHNFLYLPRYLKLFLYILLWFPKVVLVGRCQPCNLGNLLDLQNLLLVHYRILINFVFQFVFLALNQRKNHLNGYG